MGPPPVLLLDLDRTLVDVPSATDYAAALRDLADLVAGWPDVPAPRSGPLPFSAVMAVLAGLVGDPRWTAASAAVEVYERRAVADAARAVDLEAAVATWRGHRVGVVTVLTEFTAAEALAHHGVAVDAVVGRSAAHGPLPDATALTAAARLLGAGADGAVLLGGAAYDRKAADAAGMRYLDLATAPASAHHPGGGLLRHAVTTVVADTVAPVR